MVLLAPTVTALQTLLGVCHAYAGPHDIVYNTTKTVCTYAGPTKATAWVGTQHESGSEIVQVIFLPNMLPLVSSFLTELY